MIFQLATPVQRRMAAPMRMAITEVSPTEPGMIPANMSHADIPYWTPALFMASSPSDANESGVAPVAESMRLSPFFNDIQTLEPDILLG